MISQPVDRSLLLPARSTTHTAKSLVPRNSVNAIRRPSGENLREMTFEVSEDGTSTFPIGNSSWSLRTIARRSSPGAQSATRSENCSGSGGSLSTSSRGAPPAIETSAMAVGPVPWRTLIASLPELETESRLALGSGRAVDSVLSRRVE